MRQPNGDVAEAAVELRWSARSREVRRCWLRRVTGYSRFIRRHARGEGGESFSTGHEVRSKRFCLEDMTARSKAGFGMRTMKVVGGDHGHGVKVLACQHLFDVGIRLCHACQRRSDPLDLPLVGIAYDEPPDAVGSRERLGESPTEPQTDDTHGESSHAITLTGGAQARLRWATSPCAGA